MSQSELYLMHKSDFAHLLHEYPVEGLAIKKEAEVKRNVLIEAQRKAEESDVKPIFKALLSDGPAWHEKLAVVENEKGPGETKCIPNLSGFRRSSLPVNNFFFTPK